MDAIAEDILGRDDVGCSVSIEIARNDPMASVERVEADLSPRLDLRSGTARRAEVGGIETEWRWFGRCESGCKNQAGEYFDHSLHGRRFVRTRDPVVRWPDTIAPRVDSQHLASNLDVLPTLLSACSVAPPAGLPGIDLLDAEAVSDRKEIFLANFAHDMIAHDAPEKSLWTRSVIRDRWKLIEWQDPPPDILPYNGGHRRKSFDAEPPEGELADALRHVELFDLLADPHETKNLASANGPKVRQLQAAIDRWWNPSEQKEK